MEHFLADIIPPFWVVILITAGLNSIIAMGMYFSCAAGSLSIAHAAIAGLGGYTGAVLTTNFGLPFIVAIAAGAVLGFIIGVLLALITMKMHPLVAGLTTLAFGETMVIVCFNIEYLGGANSFTGIPLLTNLGVVYLVLAICMFLAWRFDRSRLGYASLATRDNMTAAAAMGINVPWVKTLVWAIGGAMASVGGVLRAHYVLVQNPEDMGFWVSITYQIYWVFGGSYNFWGPLFGAMFLTIVPEILRFSVYERFIMYGIILCVVVILRPQGVIPRRGMGTQFTLPTWLSRLLGREQGKQLP